MPTSTSAAPSPSRSVAASAPISCGRKTRQCSACVSPSSQARSPPPPRQKFELRVRVELRHQGHLDVRPLPVGRFVHIVDRPFDRIEDDRPTALTPRPETVARRRQLAPSVAVDVRRGDADQRCREIGGFVNDGACAQVGHHHPVAFERDLVRPGECLDAPVAVGVRPEQAEVLPCVMRKTPRHGAVERIDSAQARGRSAIAHQQVSLRGVWKNGRCDLRHSRQGRVAPDLRARWKTQRSQSAQRCPTDELGDPVRLEVHETRKPPEIFRLRPFGRPGRAVSHGVRAVGEHQDLERDVVVGLADVEQTAAQAGQGRDRCEGEEIEHLNVAVVAEEQLEAAVGVEVLDEEVAKLRGDVRDLAQELLRDAFEDLETSGRRDEDRGRRALPQRPDADDVLGVRERRPRLADGAVVGELVPLVPLPSEMAEVGGDDLLGAVGVEVGGEHPGGADLLAQQRPAPFELRRERAGERALRVRAGGAREDRQAGDPTEESRLAQHAHGCAKSHRLASPVSKPSANSDISGPSKTANPMPKSTSRSGTELPSKSST